MGEHQDKVRAAKEKDAASDDRIAIRTALQRSEA
jgi:hypothetical protein